MKDKPRIGLGDDRSIDISVARLGMVLSLREAHSIKGCHKK